MAKIEWVADDIITVDAKSSLSEIYPQLGDKEFYVEPLSYKASLRKFIRKGGLGYGSLKEGTFTSVVHQIEFENCTYGLRYATLYNAGYPIHRMVENGPHDFCDIPTGEIRRITFPVRKRRNLKIYYQHRALEGMELHPHAEDQLFVNGFGADLFGLEKAGVIIACPAKLPCIGEEMPINIWDNRFVGDGLPADHETIRVLTQKSNLHKAKELFDGALEKHSPGEGGLFYTLFTNLGMLLLLSGKPAVIGALRREIESLPMTWRCGKAAVRA
jgi:hypothetical protein